MSMQPHPPAGHPADHGQRDVPGVQVGEVAAAVGQE
jgi:hypothetical protein